MIISESLAHIKNQLGTTHLIAVTKTHSVPMIEQVLATGHRIFGENRVQETAQKYPDLRAKHPDIELHLIGPLQTNKIKEALDIFDVIHTLDRPKLIEKIAAHNPRNKRFLIQVNIGAEPQKAGCMVQDLPALINLCHHHHLNLVGLMCIPPIDKDPTPYFQQMAALATHYQLPEISMGMSDDYEIAIQQGATYVRIGSAIFGDRLPIPDPE